MQVFTADGEVTEQGDSGSDESEYDRDIFANGLDVDSDDASLDEFVGFRSDNLNGDDLELTPLTTDSVHATLLT